MRIRCYIFTLFLIVSISICSENSNTPVVMLFADYNTDIFLLIEDSTYVIIGYGGSNHGSADCVIKSNGTLNNNQLFGFLQSITTNIISYEITDTLKNNFSANFSDSTLDIISGNVTDICGLGSVFTRKYKKVKDNEIIKNKIDDLVDLMQGTKENENLISTLLKFRSKYHNF